MTLDGPWLHAPPQSRARIRPRKGSVSQRADPPGRSACSGARLSSTAVHKRVHT
jgi:hypothetical protein